MKELSIHEEKIKRSNEFQELQNKTNSLQQKINGIKNNIDKGEESSIKLTETLAGKIKQLEESESLISKHQNEIET